MLDPTTLRARLAALRDADPRYRVFGSEQHHYVLGAPWTEDRTRAFEARHGITLPEPYRHFLTRIGAAGAGPGFGLYEPGTWDGNPRSWEGGDRFGPLSRPFPHTQKWNLPPHRLAVLSADPDDDVLATEYWAPEIACGAMPIATIGCNVQIVLVVSGARVGKIWIDDRSAFGGLSPEDGLDFGGWYKAWLDAAEATVAAGQPPRPARRTGRPAWVVSLEGIPAIMADKVRSRVHAALATGQSLDLGDLGRFIAGAHPRFEQGVALRDAFVVNSPPPNRGRDVDVLFAALLEQINTGAAVTVDGLFTAWKIPAESWDYRDYLGRRRITTEPAMLVIEIDPAVPRHRSGTG